MLTKIGRTRGHPAYVEISVATAAHIDDIKVANRETMLDAITIQTQHGAGTL